MDEKGIVIALAGNPNSGKTSIFNFITGSRQHVGNYPGVTVEKKEGMVRVDDALVNFIDLPGTYSLTPFSPDESVARQEILSSHVSAIIAVVDATRLKRNLYLVSQIIEIGKPVVIALNMYDELEASGNTLDTGQLSTILGVPCVKTVGNRGKGITELMATALKAARNEIPAVGNPPRYSHEMEHAITDVQAVIQGKTPFNERWAAVNVLLYEMSFCPEEGECGIDRDNLHEVDTVRNRLEHLEGRATQSIVTAGRYGFATGAAAECLKEKVSVHRSISEKIDSVVTHRWVGFPIFLLLLWIMFQTTFTMGEIPGAWISNFFEWLGHGVSSMMSDGLLKSLIVEGVIAGVGGVLVFLPNIIILFFFISIFEDTGYMARSAFIMDRIMHFFGLHGKSFLPMLIGFGCTVPAIMATRIIESKRERLITMFILPFMSCGARLPVYILIASTFFPPKAAGNVIFSLYIIGIAISLVMARILTSFQGSTIPFVMELPPYRIPTLRSVLLHIWERAYMYIRKAGTLILLLSVFVWFLMSFPRSTGPVGASEPGNPNTVPVSSTYAGKIGKFIEPALRPLGLDWRIGVALTAGFAAKEVIVSSLATIYTIENGNHHQEEFTIKNALRQDPNLNPVRAYGLMLFILIYVPCIAVLATVKKEAGGWKWVILMVIYTITLAWLVSFTFVTIASHIF
ncbi:ferrous iron transport protein B [bacterium]|nr:ferrous iron transport protein B [bacterium]